MTERVSNEQAEQDAKRSRRWIVNDTRPGIGAYARDLLDARRERDEEKMRVGVLREAVDRQTEAAQDDAIEHNRIVCQLAAANKALVWTWRYSVLPHGGHVPCDVGQAIDAARGVWQNCPAAEGGGG